MKVKNTYGVEIDYDVAASLMDENLVEMIAQDICPTTEQEFFSAYEVAFEEMFGEEWELSKKNPVY